MFTDESRASVWEQVAQRDLKAFARFLSPDVVTQAAGQVGVRIVESALAVPRLIWLGLLQALFTGKSFADVLTYSVRLLDWSANGLPESVQRAKRNAKRKPRRSKHDPHGSDPTSVSEEAFAQARHRLPQAMWAVLIELLTQHFEAEHSALVCYKGFRLLALDGTTLNLPQWKRLKTHFGLAKNGKAKGTVQARMVMLQLPLVRLPWRYELAPVTTGERAIASGLFSALRKKDLVLMDQGFWSYGLFHHIQQRGAYFAIRQYPGVKFHTQKRLGKHDRLVRWNQPTGPRWRKENWPHSITLRVIDYQIKGFRKSAVVTNVLSPRHIPTEDWVRLASESEAGRSLDRRVRLRVGLYHRRWEIETTFYELKHDQGLEGGLRSRTVESICYEVAGHVVLYLLVRWLMGEAAARAAPQGDPLGLSFRHALEELLTAWPLFLISEPTHLRYHLLPRLYQAIASHQVSWRPGRSFSRKPKSKRKTRSKKNSKKTTKQT